MTTLAARVRHAPERTIDAAIARMEKIQQERVARRARRRGRAPWQSERLPDGVACFNCLYLIVTKTVTAHLRKPPAGGPPPFKAPEFVERLIPVFAQFYFQAYAAHAANSWVPRSWRPLFRLHDDDIAPLGFAAAGMNAHINHDLAYALVEVWDQAGAVPRDGTNEFQDFLTVNQVLLHAKDKAKPLLMTRGIEQVERALGDWDDMMVLAVVRRDRADAWRQAVQMHAQRRTVTEPGGGRGRVRDYDEFGHYWRDNEVGAMSMTLLFPRIGAI
jgi:hypothetical protein